MSFLACRRAQQPSSNTPEVDVMTFAGESAEGESVRTSAGGSSAVTPIQRARGRWQRGLICWFCTYKILGKEISICICTLPQSSAKWISIRLMTYGGGVQPHILVWAQRKTFNWVMWWKQVPGK